MPLDPQVARGNLGNQDILAIFYRLRFVLSHHIAAAWRARNPGADLGRGGGGGEAARLVNGRLRPRGF